MLTTFGFFLKKEVKKNTVTNIVKNIMAILFFFGRIYPSSQHIQTLAPGAEKQNRCLGEGWECMCMQGVTQLCEIQREWIQEGNLTE